jgi:hypothetical protein
MVPAGSSYNASAVEETSECYRPVFIRVKSSDPDMSDDLGTTMEILRKNYEGLEAAS